MITRASILVLLIFWTPLAFADDAPRPKAPFKVLYSNDTTNIIACVSPYHAAKAEFTDDMLRASVDEAGTADAQMLQPGMGWIPWWKSKVYPADEHYRYYQQKYGVKPNTFGRYMLAGGDLVKTFVAECRERHVAPFVSLRMNDAHGLEAVGEGSAMAAHTVSRFYEDHYKEWTIGPDRRRPDDHVLNWAIPEVRQQKLAFIRELCEGYDIDGIELDFMRYPSLFKLDQTRVADRKKIMSAFVREVRAELDRTAATGKRRWLCLRVPATLGGLDALGMDYAELADAGADMFNLSCSYYTVQQTDLKKIRQLVPRSAVYLEMTHTPYTAKPAPGGYDTFQFLRTTPEQFYTTAALAYAAGADGVSLFNFAYYREHGSAGRGPFNEPPFEVIPLLNDRDSLAPQPRWYFLSAANVPKIMRPGLALPKTLAAGQSATFTLEMLRTPATGPDAIVRLMSEQPMPGRTWHVEFNGVALSPSNFVKKPIDHPYDGGLGEADQYACFTLPRSGIREEENQLNVKLESGAAVKVIFVDAVVK